MTYLDANATEMLRPQARDAMLAALALTGNPASIHEAGRAARRVVEQARRAIGERFGTQPPAVVFTSGGTEADALAIHAFGAGRRIIVGATEHPAVLSAAPTAEVLPVDQHGVVLLERLEAMLAAGGPALVCLMLANNETGTLQPIAEAAALCRRYRARLHVDAVQAAGRIAIDLAKLGADSLAVSSHKLGGPAGVGALVLARDEAITPLIAGGGQERGRRGGTSPVAAIAGFAAALAACDLASFAGLAVLRDAIEREARELGAIVLGGETRLANTSCLALPGRSAQTQVIALDLAGICVSAGAACSSGKVSTSHVLRAMGREDLAGCAIRVSLPWSATEADGRAFLAAYAAMAATIQPSVAEVSFTI